MAPPGSYSLLQPSKGFLYGDVNRIFARGGGLNRLLEVTWYLRGLRTFWGYHDLQEWNMGLNIGSDIRIFARKILRLNDELWALCMIIIFLYGNTPITPSHLYMPLIFRLMVKYMVINKVKSYYIFFVWASWCSIYYRNPATTCNPHMIWYDSCCSPLRHFSEDRLIIS